MSLIERLLAEADYVSHHRITTDASRFRIADMLREAAALAHGEQAEQNSTEQDGRLDPIAGREPLKGDSSAQAAHAGPAPVEPAKVLVTTQEDMILRRALMRSVKVVEPAEATETPEVAKRLRCKAIGEMERGVAASGVALTNLAAETIEALQSRLEAAERERDEAQEELKRYCSAHRGELTALAAKVIAAESSRAEAAKWREAVIDALVVNCIYTAAHDTDPRKAVKDLIEWEVQIALNPQVSSAAAKLQAEAVRLLRELDQSELAKPHMYGGNHKAFGSLFRRIREALKEAQ